MVKKCVWVCVIWCSLIECKTVGPWRRYALFWVPFLFSNSDTFTSESESVWSMEYLSAFGIKPTPCASLDFHFLFLLSRVGGIVTQMFTHYNVTNINQITILIKYFRCVWFGLLDVFFSCKDLWPTSLTVESHYQGISSFPACIGMIRATLNFLHTQYTWTCQCGLYQILEKM